MLERTRECRVDRLRQREALVGRADRDRGERLDTVGAAGGERTHHVLRGAELRPLRRLQGSLSDARPCLEVLGCQLVRRARATLDEPAAECEQRIAVVVGTDLRGGAIRGLEVGAGVAQEAHGA